MEIRLKDSGAVVTEHEFRAMHPNTSFPAMLTLEMIHSLGADPVLEAPAPEYDPTTQAVYRHGVRKDVLGNWVTAWAIRSLTQQEIDAATEQQWQAIKRDRDAKLAETDWLVIRATETGTPMPDAMKAYRQALRDITQQADPFAIDWPTQPQL